MLIAVGAILRYAITFHVSGVDIPTVGLILMVVGVLGLVLSVMYMFTGSDRRRELPPDRAPEREICGRALDVARALGVGPAPHHARRGRVGGPGVLRQVRHAVLWRGGACGRR